jgi:uncharacterized protein
MIGLISDTHGLLREEALRAMQDSELIIHAGDVGGREIFETLRKIAPVVAVRGNIDTDDWGKTLPLTAVAEANGTNIYVVHRIEDLDLNPATAGMGIVVSGHSHKPGRSEKGGVLYINPGSAGPRRFSLPISVAQLDLSVKPWQVRFIELSGREPQ